MDENQPRTKKQLITFLSTMINDMNAGVKVVSAGQKDLVVEMHNLKYKIRVSKA